MPAIRRSGSIPAKEHTLTRIVKVVSGDDADTLEKIAALYGAVITAGVHRASSIKVVDIVSELKSYGVETLVHDPEADPDEAMREYGIRLLDWESLPRADAVVAAVAHRSFLELGIPDIAGKLIKGGCFIDVKAMFDAVQLKAAGIGVWRL